MTRKFSISSYSPTFEHWNQPLLWLLLTATESNEFHFTRLISHVKEYNGYAAPSGVLELEEQGYGDAIKQ